MHWISISRTHGSGLSGPDSRGQGITAKASRQLLGLEGADAAT